MIKLENTNVYGFEAAIRGMRNPMNSWDKSDSEFMPNTAQIIDGQTLCYMGENDLTLMKSLSKAGSDHAKFLRMIHVSVDITAPLYWVAEHDTYKVATVRNSCSFMHKGVAKPFELSDFTFELKCEWELRAIINVLNELRNKYLNTNDFKYFRMIRELLPQGYNVRYTWDANYQVLKSIYFARKNHRLAEWRDFCDWMLTLPYFKEICVDPMEVNNERRLNE